MSISVDSELRPDLMTLFHIPERVTMFVLIGYSVNYPHNILRSLGYEKINKFENAESEFAKTIPLRRHC